MANIIYDKWLAVQASKQYAWDSGTTIKGYLVSSTSTYSPDKSHASMSALTGIQEISGYTRPTVANKTVYTDNTNHQVQYRCDDVNFGNIPVGQTVKAIIFYVYVDGNASNDFPICYIDTASDGSLPMPTANGSFVVDIPTNGLFIASQG